MIRKIYKTKTLIKLTLSTLILLLVCSPVYAQKLLVHPENKITTISQDTLRAIFSMRNRIWPDGSPITVFILNPDSKAHRQFCLNYLEIFPYQLQRVWDVMVYSGTGQSPIEVKSEVDMLKKISQTSGSIGYILKVEVPDNVKIIHPQK